MGYRLHFCTEYVKKYSGNSRFNHNTTAINNLFEWLNNRADFATDFYHNTDDLDTADELEWSRKGVDNAIAILKDMIDTGKSWADIPIYGEYEGDWSMSEWLSNILQEAEEHDGITPEYVYDFLCDASKNSDQRDAMIHFEWF